MNNKKPNRLEAACEALIEEMDASAQESQEAAEQPINPMPDNLKDYIRAGFYGGVAVAGIQIQEGAPLTRLHRECCEAQGIDPRPLQAVKSKYEH